VGRVAVGLEASEVVLVKRLIVDFDARTVGKWKETFSGIRSAFGSSLARALRHCIT